MQVARRPVLQGIAATGIATATGGFRSMEIRSPAALTPCLVLTEGIQGERFCAGVQSVLDGDVLQERVALDLDGLRRSLASPKGRVLLGLADDGLGAIAVEMARDAGARLSWLGHHTMRGGETRHRLLTVSNECGAILARALDGSASHHLVIDCTLAGHKDQFSIEGDTKAIPASVDWAAALGATLALAQAARTRSARIPSTTYAASPAGPAAGSFVSFALEL